MRFSIRYKLLLTLLVSTALVVAVMLAFTNWSFQRGFTGFVSQAQQARIHTLTLQLAEIYGEEHGWQQLAANPRRWARLVWNRGDEAYDGEHHEEHHPAPWRRGHDQGAPQPWPPRLHEDHDEHLPFAFRVMLLDADRELIFGRPEQLSRAELHPIVHQGAAVGYLAVLPGPALSQLGELRFLERQRHAFILIGLAMLALSGIIALLLAGRLVRPLHAFTEGARALAAGRYDTRIPVQSRDELGQLARDFNSLAEALAHNEQQRRQWVADISHELRTPLAVMRGELEALQDGVRPLTPEAIASLHADTLRLNRLVDDLYELSRSDLGALDYRKVPTDPLALLADDVSAMRGAFAERGLTLRFEDQLPAPLQISADPGRLSQLYRNLLGNSLYHTDPGGRVEVTARREDDRLLIDFQDSAPGVSEEHLPRLFERLYRVEPSRSRAHGGAGLGLAICRNIVEAHGGSITARPSALGGLWIRLNLPI
jgi:two-component system sensor histidine kinase BaeS